MSAGDFLSGDLFANICAFATSVANIILLIVAGRELVALSRQSKFDSDWRRKEKASEMALFYANEIIPRMSYTTAIFMMSGAEKYRRSLRADDLNAFTQKELYSLLYNGVEKDITSAIRSVKVESCISAREFLSDRMLFSNCTQDNCYKEFDYVVSEMLNLLEYFSMCMNSGVADEKILYQSLHQSFFSIVNIWYPRIASKNVLLEDRYFTHIATLYKTWRTRYNDMNEKIEKDVESLYSPVEGV